MDIQLRLADHRFAPLRSGQSLPLYTGHISRISVGVQINRFDFNSELSLHLNRVTFEIELLSAGMCQSMIRR